MTSIIKVDQIQNAAGVGGLTIDGSGYTLPKVPLFKVQLTSNFPINSNTWTKVDWSGYGQVIYDNTSSWNTSSETWTPSQAGYYLLQGNAVTGSGYIQGAGIQFIKNGSVDIGSSSSFSDPTYRADDIAVSYSALVYLNGTDSVQMNGFIYDIAAGTDNFFGSTGITTFHGYFIST